jgi:hypothetical protein
MPDANARLFSVKAATQNGYSTTFSEKVVVNPLTAELNPSEQACLPGFFTGDFKF